MEAEFRRIKGVISTQVGYAGGQTRNPTYHEVCSGRTGHAEVVEVEYDPAQVCYEKLLEVFWDNHNPTNPHGQKFDFGTQYRSLIMYFTPEQRDTALTSKAQLEKIGRYKRPVVTQIVPATEFWRAEEYHQQYYDKHSLSCKIW